jgi:hypothetical protein
MSFSDLAPELLTIIVDYLQQSNEGLSKYATVSAAFRGPIESVLFSSLRISSEDFDDFERIVQPQSPGRRDILNTLDIIIILPSYTDAECAFFERDADKQVNNESLTKALLRLFTMLSHRRESSAARPITLGLDDVYSLMDYPRRPDSDQNKWDADIGRRKDLFEHRYEHSYPCFLDDDVAELPRVSTVKKIIISPCTNRLLAPATAAILASRLPDLNTIIWKLNDNDNRYPAIRSGLRRDFARHLADLRTRELTRFELEYLHISPSNEGFRNANLLGDDGLDPFSLQLRHFLSTCNLVTITLTGPICIGSEFFWSDDQHRGLAESWPRLQTLDLDLSIVRPDGGWYLHRDPEVERDSDDLGLPDDDGYLSDSSSNDSSFNGSEESFFAEGDRLPDEYDYRREERRAGDMPIRQFRTHPGQELEGLFEAAAKAAIHMKSVKRFAVGFSVFRRGEHLDLDFTFETRGSQVTSNEHQKGPQGNRLLWRVPQGWRMGPSLENSWRRVVGDGGVIDYEEW